MTQNSETYTIAPLMQPLLPEFLDFAQKADLGAEINGIWPVSRLTRLQALLVDDSGEVRAQLRFGRDGKLRILGGELSVELKVTCQRCMQAMQYPLQAQFSLALIASEADADDLPEKYEPLLLEENEMNLPAVIEDELLLAMPLVLAHEQDCSDYLQHQQARLEREAVQAAEQKRESSPFAVLKGLRKDS